MLLYATWRGALYAYRTQKPSEQRRSRLIAVIFAFFALCVVVASAVFDPSRATAARTFAYFVLVIGALSAALGLIAGLVMATRSFWRRRSR